MNAINGMSRIHDKKNAITNKIAPTEMAMCQRLLKYKGAI